MCKVKVESNDSPKGVSMNRMRKIPSRTLKSPRFTASSAYLELTFQHRLRFEYLGI
jgi:hypothetical protein